MNKFTKTEIRNLHRIVDALKSKKIKDANPMDQVVTIKEWWGQLDDGGGDIRELQKYGITVRKTGKTRYDEKELEMRGKLSAFVEVYYVGGYYFESLGLN